MFKIIIFFNLMTFILLILMMMSILIFKKTLNSREKQSMFECGFDFLTNLRIPLSIHFYMLSIVFLIFDIELILIIPIMFMFKTIKLKLVMNILLIFMLIMMMGLLYEWYAGLINWMI
uniref:NADH-ubiquinone oxidoreductase chain 3 n=1 Tax=Neomaskellia andropogonis TaxID=266944 RepID=Q697F6_NEOAD|nr:NADH dehydrogenase subunit 3 [Neomaskellia andropogonis]